MSCNPLSSALLAASVASATHVAQWPASTSSSNSTQAVRTQGSLHAWTKWFLRARAHPDTAHHLPSCASGCISACLGCRWLDDLARHCPSGNRGLWRLGAEWCDQALMGTCHRVAWRLRFREQHPGCLHAATRGVTWHPWPPASSDGAKGVLQAKLEERWREKQVRPRVA